MRIDLSCPAEILRIDPPTEGNPYGILTLFNLTADRAIVSCEVTLKLIDAEGAERGRTVHRARALAGRPHTAFLMSVPLEPADQPVHGEATLDKVWFEDNDVWRRNPEAEKEYESNVLAPGNELNALKFVAGENAVGFPSQQPGVWLCVCGRPNSNRDDICVRCLRQKDYIFAQYNREQVGQILHQRERQLDLQSRSAREEGIRLQRLREEEYNRQQVRRSRRKRRLIALGCALALTAATVWGIVPGLRLLSAREQLAAGALEDAREILLGLDRFPGAEETLAECELRIARRDAAESTDPDVLSHAITLLRDREEDDLADRAELKKATILLENGKIAEAESLLRILPEELPGREEALLTCTYQRGRNAMAERDFETARTLFLSLGNWRDAAQLADACLYEPALTLIEAGEYDRAIELLRQIPTYADSADLILKSYYLKGYVLENAGDADAAREAYLAAGSWEDAQERANALLLAKADALMANKDYADALPLYESLDGYADAREKRIACAYALAERSYKDREYLQAIDVLDALPPEAETQDITSLRNKAIYQAARNAAKQENYEEAIALMERIPTYSDAADRLTTWRYALALRYTDEKKWTEAIPLLEQLDDYRRSRSLLRKAQEALAAEEAEAEAAAEEALKEATEQPENAPADAETDPEQPEEDPSESKEKTVE